MKTRRSAAANRKKPPASRAPAPGLAPAWGFFACSRLLILFAVPKYVSDVEVLYFPAARAWFGEGRSPYRGFHFPYPPLALALIAPPAWLGSTLDGYRLAFQLEMAALDLACAALIVVGLRAHFPKVPRAAPVALWVYSGLGVACANLLYDRLDLALALALIAAWTTFRPSRGFSGAGYAALGLGFGVKLAPLVWSPFAAIIDAARASPGAAAAPGKPASFSNRRLATRLALGTALPCALLELANLASGGAIFANLRDHTERGIQIESAWACPLLLLKAFDPTSPIAIEYVQGALHLTPGSVPGAYLCAARWLPPAVIAALLALTGWRARARARAAAPPLTAAECLDGMLAVLLTLIATGRVLSPQYVIWVIPLLAARLAIGESARAALLTVAVCGLNFLVFPLGFRGIWAAEPAWILTLCARDLSLLVAAGYFVGRMLKGRVPLNAGSPRSIPAHR